jgi:hypothetical protein
MEMKEITIYTISRREVAQQDYTRFDRTVGLWADLKGQELRDRHNGLVIVIDGYNEIDEELYAIPEVREYMRGLHKRWPWLLFFSNIEPMGEHLAIAYLCLVDVVNSVRRDGSEDTCAIFHPDQMLDLLRRDFCRMNWLFEQANMSDTDNERRTDEILALLFRRKELPHG